LKDSNANPNVKIVEEEEIRVFFFVHSTEGGQGGGGEGGGACWSFEMGTRTNDKRVNYSY
jgi:hypothetical protein